MSVKELKAYLRYNSDSLLRGGWPVFPDIGRQLKTYLLLSVSSNISAGSASGNITIECHARRSASFLRYCFPVWWWWPRAKCAPSSLFYGSKWILFWTACWWRQSQCQNILSINQHPGAVGYYTANGHRPECPPFRRLCASFQLVYEINKRKGSK